MYRAIDLQCKRQAWNTALYSVSLLTDSHVGCFNGKFRLSPHQISAKSARSGGQRTTGAPDHHQGCSGRHFLPAPHHTTTTRAALDGTFCQLPTTPPPPGLLWAALFASAPPHHHNQGCSGRHLILCNDPRPCFPGTVRKPSFLECSVQAETQLTLHLRTVCLRRCILLGSLLQMSGPAEDSVYLDASDRQSALGGSDGENKPARNSPFLAFNTLKPWPVFFHR